MISRAVRVPRIRLACRYGLITQRGSGLGFRPIPAHEGLGRRLYTSDIGNTGNSKVETFITNTDASKPTPREDNFEEKLEESSTGSQDVTSATNYSPTTDVDSELPTRTEEVQLDEDSVSNPHQELQSSPDGESFSEKPIDNTQVPSDDALDESSSQPQVSNYVLPDLPDLPESSSRQSQNSEQYALDDLLGESEKENIKVFALPELDSHKLEDELMPLPKKRLQDRLMHDESLGVPTLGLPADAIIINNPNMTRIERPAPTVIEEEPIEKTNLDWEELTPAQETETKAEEIFTNIDEFRPEGRILRLTDIEKLVEALCHGFTLTQLREYHSAREPEPKDHDIVKYDWIEDSIPWTSINSVQLRGNDKTTIARKIVLHKWNIEVQEYVDDLGKAFIWMDSDIFPFLTYGPNNIGRLLWELRRDFVVGEDEKLTLHTSKCRLNITAKKSTAYGILAHIDQAVQKMKSRVIDVAPFLPTKSSGALTAEERKELGRLTKTSITPVRHGKEEKLRVSWMPEPDEGPTETEDLADVVFRLIVGRVVPGADLGSLHCIQPSREEGIVSGQPVPVHRQARAMSWRDKLKKWVRIVAPTGKTFQEPWPFDWPSRAAVEEEKCSRSDHRDATTATFGHILHQRESTSIKELFRQRRILAPLTPHPAAFSPLRTDNNQPLKETTTIVMHLVPHVSPTKVETSSGQQSPEDPAPQGESSKGRVKGGKKVPADPAVYITIPIHSDADLANFKIPKDMTAHCYVTWHTSDVLLPTEVVDVRLEHKRSFPLKVTQSGLRAFLKKSELNLAEGRLRTPSQAKLSVPGSWLRGHRSGRLATEKVVLYDFRGTEFHKTVEIPWGGHTLRYSSIEAGLHGGQRQEITLQAGLPGENPVAFKGERRDSFLDSVREIATGKFLDWSEGYRLVKSRQLEDFSYDLPEEALPEDVIVDNEKFTSCGRVKRHRPAIEMGSDEFDSHDRITEGESAMRAHNEELGSRVDEHAQGQEPKKDTEVEFFDDIEKLLAADGQTFELSEDKKPKPDEEEPVIKDQALDVNPDKKPEPYEEKLDPINQCKATDDLMSFLDEYATPKAFVGEDNKKLYGIDAAYYSKNRSRTSASDNGQINDWLREETTPTQPSKTDAAAKKEKIRKKVQAEYFAAPKSVPKPSATPKKPAAAENKSKKYTLPDLRKPATKSDVDAFAAQFAKRATSDNRAKDENKIVGFFDSLPSEKRPGRKPAANKKSPQKKQQLRNSKKHKR
ncbi:hypothetical protein FBEOM_12518 [Fusarium beomiforme]|uniref:Uncharacterized protein n=1 Tax=Fusarium beomiforme TaxID=44412 RepID=A0A9P5A7Y6_9HYPO|nr:hypothetical protein FBEOM_12518 [Fusarium beomiforme]